MTKQIDFYHLKNPKSSWLLFACRIIEKAYKENKKLWVFSSDKARLAQLDELLWTYNDISFIPHRLSAEDLTCPIILNTRAPENADNFILLNLDISVPEFYSIFERVLEIIPGEDELKQQARRRYAFYQKQNITPTLHDIAS